jgi:hypothetical protein
VILDRQLQLAGARFIAESLRAITVPPFSMKARICGDGPVGRHAPELRSCFAGIVSVRPAGATAASAASAAATRRRRYRRNRAADEHEDVAFRVQIPRVQPGA